jgi:hypothetical protein
MEHRVTRHVSTLASNVAGGGERFCQIRGTKLSIICEKGSRTMSKLENKNALKHGAFAAFLIMPDEDLKEFEALLAALTKEWNPEGRCENEKIESIAMSMWRKRRFRKHMERIIAKIARKEALIDDIQDRDSERMMNILEEIESGIPGCVTEESLLEKLGPRWADRLKKIVSTGELCHRGSMAERNFWFDLRGARSPRTHKNQHANDWRTILRGVVQRARARLRRTN